MNEFQWAKVAVYIVEHSDNSIVIQDKEPLADGPANLCTWLHRHAAFTPDKPFILERIASGQWEGVTHAEALNRVNTTDKGYLNQNAVLAHHKEPVDDLYTDPPLAHVIVIYE